jgi:hypothetical protein
MNKRITQLVFCLLIKCYFCFHQLSFFKSLLYWYLVTYNDNNNYINWYIIIFRVFCYYNGSSDWLCCNPSLGLTTKAKAYKGTSQKWSPGVTFHVPGSVGKCEGINPHTPKWTPIWELEPRWTPKFSKGDYKGQYSLNWRVLYIFGKILDPRCLIWACTSHLST